MASNTSKLLWFDYCCICWNIWENWNDLLMNCQGCLFSHQFFLSIWLDSCLWVCFAIGFKWVFIWESHSQIGFSKEWIFFRVDSWFLVKQSFLFIFDFSMNRLGWKLIQISLMNPMAKWTYLLVPSMSYYWKPERSPTCYCVLHYKLGNIEVATSWFWPSHKLVTCF